MSLWCSAWDAICWDWLEQNEAEGARGSGACWDDLLSCWRGDLLRGHAASKSSAVRGTRVPAPGYKTRRTTDTANHTPHSLSSHMFRADPLQFTWDWERWWHSGKSSFTPYKILYIIIEISSFIIIKQLKTMMMMMIIVKIIKQIFILTFKYLIYKYNY